MRSLQTCGRSSNLFYGFGWKARSKIDTPPPVTPIWGVRPAEPGQCVDSETMDGLAVIGVVFLVFFLPNFKKQAAIQQITLRPI